MEEQQDSVDLSAINESIVRVEESVTEMQANLSAEIASRANQDQEPV